MCGAQRITPNRLGVSYQYDTDRRTDGGRRRFRLDQVRCVGGYGLLSRRELLDTSKLACDPRCRKAGTQQPVP